MLKFLYVIDRAYVQIPKVLKILVKLSRQQEIIQLLKQVIEPILKKTAETQTDREKSAIENMSYFLDRNGDRTPIFGSGGGEKLAAELKVPLLGKIPLDSRICDGGDFGHPIAIAEPTSKVSQVFIQIAAALNSTFCSVAR